MNIGVVFIEILNNPLSWEMRGDVVRNNREFGGISDGINDAMLNGSGNGSGEDDMKAEDISVLIPELVF